MSGRPVTLGRAPRAVLAHPWLTVLGWAVFFLVLTPTALTYTHVVNYSGSSSTLAGTESDRAQALLATVVPSHSTLIVAVNVSAFTSSRAQNDTLAFQQAIPSYHIAYLNSTDSVYRAFAGYLDGAFGSEVPTARSMTAAVGNLTVSVYAFPSRFLSAWVSAGAARGTINSTFATVGGSATGYEAAFRDALWTNFTSASTPAFQAQTAIVATAPGNFPAGPALNVTLRSTNVTAYSSAVPALVAQLLTPRGGSTVPESWVVAALLPGDFGANYVASNGLVGLPSFLRAQFVSPDGSLELILVLFNVTDSFRTSDGTYPAQAATPTVRSVAQAEFGGAALVTGSGAAAYDSQQLENGAGFLFALTFLFLAVAVALTLRSWIAPLLALVLVSLSTVVGYLAILATGLIVAKVDFTVTYTVTAVTLGVATDYALFFLYRYREELTRGRDPETALRTATRTSGWAIIVSAVTVAVGLGTLSFLSGLETWGPVLFGTVIGVGLLEVTLLPALIRLIGPRLFVRRWLRPAGPVSQSVFYRAARGSSSRPLLVLTLAAVIAVPAVMGFLLVPTSYDFSGGLPSSTPSAQGQQLIEQKFGANLLYPTYVIVTAQTTFVEPNGTVSPEGLRVLPAVAGDLLHHAGVQSVDGPFVAGTNVTTLANGSSGVAAYSLEGGTAVYYTVYSSYGPYSTSALSLVESLRGNSSYLVGGLTSSVVDQQALDNVQYPALELVITLFIGIILAVAFRSLWVPLISLSGVFLSISVTTGVLYLISTYLLHTAFLWLIPLILFVILMSLGNDYTVFLLTRIREEQSNHGPFEGIRRGIAGSGVVVSALGLILAASLGSLALQPLSFLQEIGIAFVISLLLDTFVVRPFYFPAVLTLVEKRRRARLPDGVLPTEPATTETES
ncbi:MAG TPA: MMPL family transporter [Thermoplasmata archaeon]